MSDHTKNCESFCELFCRAVIESPGCDGTNPAGVTGGSNASETA